MSCTRNAGVAVDRLLFVEAAPADVDTRQVAPYTMVDVAVPVPLL